MNFLSRCTKVAAVCLLGFTCYPGAEVVAQKATPPAVSGTGQSAAFVGQKPQFKAGSQAMTEFINANIRHPRPGSIGIVNVSFIVETDGSLHNVQVVKPVSEEFDREAIQAVKLMDRKWEPGTVDGKPTRMQQVLPILFNPASKLAADNAQAGSAGAEGEKPYTFAEKMPMFHGGEKEMFNYIGQHLKYPEAAIEQRVEGHVFVSFIVEKDGSVRDVLVLRGMGVGTDEEAIRIIQSMNGKWTPGSQNGRLVPVRYNLPIRFQLDNESGSIEAKRPAPEPFKSFPVVADKAPLYKGGEEALHQALAKQLLLPKQVTPENIFAGLSVKFVVEKDGSLTNIRLEDSKVIKTIGPGSGFDYMDGNKIGLLSKTTLVQLAEAAASALKNTSGNWEAGTRHGQKDRVEVELPITYLGAATPVIGNTNVSDSKQPALLKDNPKHNSDMKSVLRFISENIRYPEGASDCGQVTASIIIGGNKIIKEVRYNMASTTPFDEEVRRVMELIKGSKFDDPARPKLLMKPLTIHFQTQKSGEQKAPLKPADIYVVRYK